jgi:hypothetical protein
MKCYESQTTSTTEIALQAHHVRASAREGAVAFEAMLFAQMLKPFSQSLGFFGDAALAACANSIARHERGGFSDRIERLLAAGSNA